jgi:hypothetical protein
MPCSAWSGQVEAYVGQGRARQVRPRLALNRRRGSRAARIKKYAAADRPGQFICTSLELYDVAARRYASPAAAARGPSDSEAAQKEINCPISDRAFGRRFVNNEPGAVAEIHRLQLIVTGRGR